MSSKRQIMLGGVAVGGGAPVSVQSMTCTPTADVNGTLAQVDALVAAGCDIVRIALPSAGEVDAFRKIVGAVHARHGTPIVADVHFDWRLAVAAIGAGADGVRINPGTIGSQAGMREIVKAAAAGPQPVAIRIGVNSGSLPRRLRGRAQTDPVGALVEAAIEYAQWFEDQGFAAFKISAKSSSVPHTIAAYRLLSQRTEAPLHVGVTEAGTLWSGTIKSAVGIGALLADGIGDTLRVSLTGDPVEEVRVGWRILSSLQIRRRGPDVISCPTCGRTEIDIIRLAEEVERRLQSYTEPITVAVMGCRVNGPEEARHADFGIAGGRGEGIVFAQGQRVATAAEDDLVEKLFEVVKAALVKGRDSTAEC